MAPRVSRTLAALAAGAIAGGIARQKQKDARKQRQLAAEQRKQRIRKNLRRKR